MGLLGKLLLASVTFIAVGIGYVFYTLNQVPELPELKSTWWGAGQPRKLDESIRSFKVNISDDVCKTVILILEGYHLFLKTFRCHPPFVILDFQHLS
jgi:hypothetical protein